MDCVNCETALKQHEKYRQLLVCPQCGLHHNDHGQDLGWPVMAGQTGGGVIELPEIKQAIQELASKTNTQVNLKHRYDIAALIGHAARVGLKRISELTHELDKEKKIIEFWTDVPDEWLS